MSLLSVFEQAIESCKAEQQKIDESIRLYREILQTFTPQPRTSSDESECENPATTDTNTSPGEREDIELLEQLLEKALWVRTGSGASKKDPDRDKQSGPRKEPGNSAVTSKHLAQSSASSKGSQTTIRSTSQSASLDRKQHKKPGSSLSSSLGSRPSACNKSGPSKTSNNRGTVQKHPVSSAGAVPHHAARKSQRAGLASASLDCSNKKTVKGSEDLRKAAAVSTSSSNNIVPFSHTDKPEAHRLPQHNETPLEQMTKWKSLRSKQNRLWDKVMALQRKPVPGRSHFMERMRATFPKDLPCGSPDQTRVLVDRLTHQGHDLIHQYQTTELLAKLTPEAGTEQGGKKNKCDSYTAHERLQMTLDLQKSADQVKQEWEAWDRWRPAGGCRSSTGATSVWEDGTMAGLPLTVTYTTEAELQELERLRMRVALLQQEINLEQALFDALSPRLSSIAPGPGCPSASVLRDMYSLLGEGGEHFPAIVQDSEPD